MKTRFTPSLALSLLFAASAFADPADFGANITIFDNNSRTHSWYGNHEDNETETNPDTLIGQQWDLEGIFLDNNLNLTLVGGYDFKNGAVANGKTYRSGDIFIDIDGDASYGLPLAGSVTGGSGNNIYGWDYVMKLDFTSMTFDVLQIDETTQVYHGTDVARSNPWRLKSGGLLLDGYEGVAFTYTSGLTNTDTGFLGYSGNNNHYSISLDVSFLAGSTATFHYTMECGNDNLIGRADIPSVPDASSTGALLAAALLTAHGIARRRALVARRTQHAA